MIMHDNVQVQEHVLSLYIYIYIYICIYAETLNGLLSLTS